MTQPHQAESALSQAESASNNGVASPSRVLAHAGTRPRMLQLIASAGISLGALVSAPGCGGSDTPVAPINTDSGTDGGTDVCGNVCGQGTHCNTSTAKCEPNTDACGNVCGPSTHCNASTAKCEPNAAPSFGGITWQNPNSNAGNGWTDELFGTDKDYALGTTQTFAQSETPVAVCITGSGDTTLKIDGSGEWWDITPTWLATQTGHSLSDTAFFHSKDASKAAAGEFLSYRSTPPAYRPANAFVWRGAGTNQTWIDPAASDTIHCAHIPSNGAVEMH